MTLYVEIKGRKVFKESMSTHVKWELITEFQPRSHEGLWKSFQRKSRDKVILEWIEDRMGHEEVTTTNMENKYFAVKGGREMKWLTGERRLSWLKSYYGEPFYIGSGNPWRFQNWKIHWTCSVEKRNVAITTWRRKWSWGTSEQRVQH